MNDPTVERLRDQAGEINRWANTMIAGAYEITRLREKAIACEAEIARLRGALRRAREALTIGLYSDAVKQTVAEIDVVLEEAE